MRVRRALLLLSLPFALGACSALPDYAAPKAMLTSPPASIELTDVIAYRPLVRDDFKGLEPPPAFARYAEQVGAATCAHLLTTRVTQGNLESVQSPDGTTVYRARSRNLGFQAQMDRRCSWWNPKDIGVPEDYILEHEQIHFALVEVEARRMNASVSEIESRLVITARTPEVAIQRFREQLEKEVQDRMERVLARNREFDEDTSMGHKPEPQKRWLREVQAELAAYDESRRSKP